MTSEHESYTIAELSQAMKETGNSALAGEFLSKLKNQADKNRLVKNPPEFTEEQVHTAVADVLIRDHGYTAYHAASLASAVITQLRGKPQEFVHGGVYKKPSGKLWRRSGSLWEKFGDSWVFSDVAVGTADLERVL